MKKIILVFIAFLLVSCNSTRSNTSSVTEEEQVTVVSVEDEEYIRSVKDVEVSKEEFSNDKKEILKIIDELSIIMINYDYENWLTYIDPESKLYWSKPVNLKKVSKRLPIKGQYLNNLNDYFRYIFVPSRKNQTVDEIRYISKENIKAVQVRGMQDIVYYNFRKINNKWMVSIPALES